MWRTLLAFFTALTVSVVVMPVVIFFAKKLKMRQTVLHYVDNHASKSGTPTMGGIGIIVAIAAGALSCMTRDATLMIVALLISVGYGVVGFLDDFIKIYFKQNKGLSAWQKILFQTAIALVVSLFAYYNETVAGSIFIPFTLQRVSLGWMAVPLFILIFLAFTNAVNLTDGLDGLASSVTLVYMLFNAGLIFAATLIFGEGQALRGEFTNLLIFCAAVIGAIVGFMCFNGFPAKIFMGDTGALALGGAVGSVAVVSGMSLYSPIIGIMYVLTCASVIIQVLYFKATKGKRIFLMAPLHHHFERKGIHEHKIVTAYTAITAAVGSICLAITLVVQGM
ncbi:MAG: phospho-N-acetylmuramoyl-pentapeptide-transferase [Firmicutes bacterium]|nr:phospho-N-acetylmuramoyl-pentapeptide-transferase [Bacillota bacterium]